ncbi:MAG: acyl-CoA dehydrogenase family protein [Trueperaceae bacterium]
MPSKRLWRALRVHCGPLRIEQQGSGRGGDAMTVSPLEGAKAGGSFLIECHPASEIQVPEAFDDELRMVGQSARQFVEREILPDFEALEGLDYELSRKKLRTAGELGLLGIDVPEEFGGLQLTKTASLLVAEKLSASGSFNVTFNAHTCIGTLPIVYFGSEEQKSVYLPRLASGEWVAAYCLTEPGSGSDARAAKTRALLSEDGREYRLNGSKMWITNAGFADLFIVFAQVDGERFTAFLVERETEGLGFGAEERKLGIKGSSTRQLILDDVRVPIENVLGEIGKGHKIAFSILNLGRLKLAAGAVGGSKEMLRLASGYAQEREQFGRPIAEFGLIREKIGGMAAHIFALESAVYRVAGEVDRRLVGCESDNQRLSALDEYIIEYSLIKVYGSEILDEVIDEALQIFGGNGYSAEYPVELAYRNARINRIFEGTSEINRLLVTGQLLKRAMSGRLDLMSAGQAALQGKPAQQPDVPASIGEAALAVEGLKRGALLVATAAALIYGERLEAEQEILARAADMVALTYLADSGLLRAERLLAGKAGEQAALLAQIYALEAVDQGRMLATEALRRVPGGADHLAALAVHLPEHGCDLIELRREAASAVYERGGYPLA